MSDRLVSPATWRKTLRRFLLLISWGRVQTIQKTSLVCFYFFFNHIYEESVPDRTMRVQSLFCTCFEFDTANQSGKSTYNFLMIWRTALRRTDFFKNRHYAGAISQDKNLPSQPANPQRWKSADRINVINKSVGEKCSLGMKSCLFVCRQLKGLTTYPS